MCEYSVSYLILLAWEMFPLLRLQGFMREGLELANPTKTTQLDMLADKNVALVSGEKSKYVYTAI